MLPYYSEDTSGGRSHFNLYTSEDIYPQPASSSLVICKLLKVVRGSVQWESLPWSRKHNNHENKQWEISLWMWQKSDGLRDLVEPNTWHMKNDPGKYQVSRSKNTLCASEKGLKMMALG